MKIRPENTFQIAEGVAEQVRLALAKRAISSFKHFIPWSWPILEPGVPFVDNWHIGAIAEHLEAVTRGEIQRLIINMPFRMLKSTIVSQMWPAYEWLHDPTLQYLTASYAKDLATRDSVNSRRIIESAQYQDALLMMPADKQFKMTSDQNVKTRYENDKRGQRVVTATDAASTGFGGSRIIVDDPISAKMADSPLAIASSLEWWRGTMATRFNNPATDAAVVTHQRLNENDLTGYLIAEEGNWCVLRLPMRYDPLIITTSPLRNFDPRTSQGELLMPQRLPEGAVKNLERSLGTYHTKAQLQQDPSPRGGNLFTRTDWRYWDHKLPPKLDIVLSLDATFKDLNTSDFVSLQAWGAPPQSSKINAHRYMLDRWYKRAGITATMKALIDMHKKFADSCIAVLIEDKANGTAIVELLMEQIPGIIAVNPEGGKFARAQSVQPLQEAGNLYIPALSKQDFPWVAEYIDNMARFPATPDDDTDSTSQALIWFRNRKGQQPDSPAPATGGLRVMPA